MKIYFAAPLFNEAECHYNLSVTEKLEKIGYNVFLPQRDGIMDDTYDDPSPANRLSQEKKYHEIFKLDRENIIDSDVFLFILDGRVPDEGACVELGIAYEHKIQREKPKYIIGLHTDTRAAHLGAKFNPMIKVPIDYLAEDENNLLLHLQELLKQEK
ncbi:MAG: nucleoside 2-deoxyribosyltransferase [Patescibacteria group bacterium]